MIPFQEIRERLDADPFEPFQIRLVDGRVFKVVRRDMCILTERSVYVGVPDPKSPGIVKRVDSCRFDYACAIEELATNGARRAKRGSNGTRGQGRGKGR
jgi:hypothetical protein